MRKSAPKCLKQKLTRLMEAPVSYTARTAAVAAGISVLVMLIGPNPSLASEWIVDDGWETLAGADENYPPPADGFEPVELPACTYGISNDSAWFRNEIELPSLSLGESTILRFWALRYDAQIWVNGINVYIGSYPHELPLDVDITDVVSAGFNTVEVFASDWLSLAPAKVTPPVVAPGEDARSKVTDLLTAPLPSNFGCFGILDSVEVRVVPSVRFDHIEAVTTLTPPVVRVRATLTNEHDEPVQIRFEGAIEDHTGLAIKSFGQDGVWVYPGPQEVVLPVSAGDVHTWTPDDPYLYTVVGRVKMGGDVLHEVTEKFGFRQLGVNGSRLLFNGSPTRLRVARWDLGPQAYGAADPAAELQSARDNGVDVIWFAGGIWPQRWFRAATEVGLMAVVSTAIQCDKNRMYRYSSSELEQAIATESSNLVRAAQGHTSVVMYAPEDSFLLCAQAGVMAKSTQFVESAVGTVKAGDEYRLVATPGDLGGVGEPQVDWWFMGHTVLESRSDFVGALAEPQIAAGSGSWSFQGKRPLVVSDLALPSADAVAARSLVGPEGALRMLDAEDEAARAFELLRDSLWLEDVSWVGGLWVTAGLPDFLRYRAYLDGPRAKPVRLVPRSPATHFQAGESRSIKWDLLVTGSKSVAGTVRVKGPQGQTLLERAINMAPGESQGLEVVLSGPAVPQGDKRTEFLLFLEVDLEDMDWTEESKWYSYPAPPAPSLDAPVLVLDSSPEFSALIGAKTATVSDQWVDLATSSGLVVVAPGFLQEAAAGLQTADPPAVYSDLESVLLYFVDRGGTLLVFPQESFLGALPFGLVPAAGKQMFTRGHAFSQGLDAVDLSGWLGETASASFGIEAPVWGSWNCALEMPSPAGGAGCIVAEVARGSGRILLVQADLVTLASEEPVAGLLLSRILESASKTETQTVQPRVSATDPALQSRLKALDLTVVPGEMAQECADLVVHQMSGQVSDSLMSELAVSYKGVDTLWVVMDNVLEASGLPAWNGKGLVEVPARVLPARAWHGGDGGLLELLAATWWYPAWRPEWLKSSASLAASGAGQPVDLDKVDFSEANYFESKGDRCIGPHGVAFIPLDEAGESSPYRVDLTMDTRGPTSDLLVSLTGDRTQAVVLSAPENELDVSWVMESGRGGHLVLRLESNVTDPQSGTVSAICLKQITVTQADDLPEGSLDTLPAWWLRSDHWGVPAFLDGSGVWASPANDPAALPLLSSVLESQGFAVDTPLGLLLPAQDMSVVDSQLVQIDSDLGIVWLRDNGKLEKTIEFPLDGNYRIMVTGIGRPANGQYPKPRLLVDGESVGTAVFSGQMKQAFADFTVEKGPHIVGVQFLDDAYMPPEDRDAGFKSVAVFALRPNHAPLGEFKVMPSGEDGLNLRAVCVVDADGDEVSMQFQVSSESCDEGLSEAIAGEHVKMALEPGSYWVVLTVTDEHGSTNRVCRLVSYVPEEVLPDADTDLGCGGCADAVEPETDGQDTGGLPFLDAAETDGGGKPGKGGGCSSGGDGGSEGSGNVLLLVLALVLLSRRLKFGGA